MCFESSWYQKKRERDELEKAKQDADKLIEQARMASRKPSPAPTETIPAAGTEESDT